MWDRIDRKHMRELMVDVISTVLDEPKRDLPALRIVDEDLKVKWYEDWQPLGYYAFYGQADYLWLTYQCWADVTAGNVASAISWLKDDKSLVSIADLWAGCGLSTAELAMAFPDSLIQYHNAKGLQWDAARELFSRLELANVIMTDKYPKADAVMAFECFEHFQSPIPHFEQAISERTRWYVDSSSFAYRGVGHFDEYMVGERPVNRRKYRREFFKAVAAKGFQRISHRFWQDRPAIFSRLEV